MSTEAIISKGVNSAYSMPIKRIKSLFNVYIQTQKLSFMVLCNKDSIATQAPIHQRTSPNILFFLKICKIHPKAKADWLSFAGSVKQIGKVG